MNPYVNKLKEFLAQQTPCFGYDDAASLLEMLYYYYTTANPINSAAIQCQFKELDSILNRLSFADYNSIFDRTVSLCVSHERKAFLDGIHVGLRLFSELSSLPERNPAGEG